MTSQGINKITPITDLDDIRREVDAMTGPMLQEFIRQLDNSLFSAIYSMTHDSKVFTFSSVKDMLGIRMYLLSKLSPGADTSGEVSEDDAEIDYYAEVAEACGELQRYGNGVNNPHVMRLLSEIAHTINYGVMNCSPKAEIFEGIRKARGHLDELERTLVDWSIDEFGLDLY